MKKVLETTLLDLSGGTLFPNLYPEYGDFEVIRSSNDYLVSSLSLGTMTKAFRQIDPEAREDVDTFAMRLDAGDTYQLVFSTEAAEQFLSYRGMTVFGADGSYVGLILNDYGNTFSASGTLTTATFTAQSRGDYLLFAKFSGGSVTTSYGLTLERVADITPWHVSLSRDGMGAKAVIASDDTTIRAGTQITIYLTFSTSNISLDDVRMLVPGSMSTWMSSTDISTTVSVTMTASQDATLRDLVEISFIGSGNAGSLSVSNVSVQVAGSSVVVDAENAVTTPGNMVLVGTTGNDKLTGDIGSDSLSGLAGSDTLNGGAGNDVIDGGAGADFMAGGSGDDVYLVDSAADLTFEDARQGTDHVRSSISHTLADNVENLTLLGNSALIGTGNALANLINGNAGNNTLNGLDGADTLNGGVGADSLLGGTGNDTYIIDSVGDRISEALGAGSDLVRSSVSYKLGANLENLTLTGTGALNGTGNGLANRITGNGAANVLNGGSGNDTLVGGRGNDTYIVNGGDTIIENRGGGIDLVRASTSFTLGANLENLTLTGTVAINGTGNEHANWITGNGAANTLNGGNGHDTLLGGGGRDILAGGNGNDRLSGGAGNDRLTGGAGSDVFIFENSLRPGNADQITDFSTVADSIHLDDAIFTGLAAGRLSVSAFRASATGLAQDASDRILYETDTGRLFFDADGAGGSNRILFATLARELALTSTDFFVF
ncbi:calcium-binding protein [Cereibacter sphaeroides]|nr:calcium-binding protein [Cereibacter sphaeroides]AZB71286.1 calcium-binding protein [Cereibacter sphaeroides]